MNTIILTSQLNEGKKLQKILSQFDSNFNNTPVLVKKDILNQPRTVKNCKWIFSSWYMPVFSEEEIKNYLPSLKCIFYAAGTVKYFAEPFLRSGVRVFSSSAANGIPVAEFTASQIILAGKGYFQAMRAYKWPIWHRGFRKARGFAERKYGNYGATIGIIGCGSIGSKVVELLKPYKLKIYVYDPYISDDKILKLGVHRVSLEELFCSCDVITNHLPDIPETRGIIGETLLRKMKPEATFINTGRGAQIDEAALNRILKAHKNICALLDVTSHEPLFPWSPLFWRKNVFLTPHIAGSLSNEFGRMVEYMVNAYQDVLEGKQNVNEMTLDIIAKQSTH